VKQASPLIYDSAGAAVGYFRITSTQEGSFHSKRGSFVTYFAGAQGLIETSGEIRCYKIPNFSGDPKLHFFNAR
jgi:hypothetical protein